MTEDELTAIEARMRGLPMWTRPEHLLQDVPALVAEVRRLQARLGPETPANLFRVKLPRAKERAMVRGWHAPGYHDIKRWRRQGSGHTAACSCGASMRLSGEDGAWYLTTEGITEHCPHHHMCLKEDCPEGYAYRMARY